MSIKIKTEKVVLRGVAYRKVIEISGVLPKSELPDEYIAGRDHSGENPCIFAHDGAIIVFSCAGHLYTGHSYPEADFQRSITAIKAAGNRLHEINKKTRATTQTWNGEETFII